MKIPPSLKKGDKVAIISPAAKIKRSVIERGRELLLEQGFVVEIGEHAFDEEGIFAGSDEARTSDMQKALNDKNIKAIFFSRGGYGCFRIQQKINWSAFFKRPKWLIGFSDITVFHSFVNCHKIASVHGVMPAFFETDGQLTDSFQKTLNLLANPSFNYTIEPHPLNRLGETSGRLTGGNLSILLSLRGTNLDINPKGKILFIEDISEYNYHIDRMMMNFKAGGILEKISGLVAGHFTEMKDGETPFGRNAYEIILDYVSSYKYPVVFNFPAGHRLPNWPLIMGSVVQLNVGSDKVSIQSINR